jgi:hypothetical protein
MNVSDLMLPAAAGLSEDAPSVRRPTGPGVTSKRYFATNHDPTSDARHPDPIPRGEPHA